MILAYEHQNKPLQSKANTQVIPAHCCLLTNSHSSNLRHFKVLKHKSSPSARVNPKYELWEFGGSVVIEPQIISATGKNMLELSS